MTNVLVPTDFSTGSMELVELAAQTIGEPVNIFLFHAFDMPGSLIDVMLRKGVNNHSNLITEELRLKCRQLKMNNVNIGNVSFRMMYGSTNTSFKNFAEANAIDIVVLPENYFFMPTVRESVNPVNMIKKSGLPVISRFDLKKTLPKVMNNAVKTNRLQGTSVTI